MEEQQEHYLAIVGRNKEIDTFPKGINPKMDVIKFKLSNFDITVQHFWRYAIGTLPNI